MNAGRGNISASITTNISVVPEGNVYPIGAFSGNSICSGEAVYGDFKVEGPPGAASVTTSMNITPTWNNAADGFDHWDNTGRWIAQISTPNNPITHFELTNNADPSQFNHPTPTGSVTVPVGSFFTVVLKLNFAVYGASLRQYGPLPRTANGAAFASISLGGRLPGPGRAESVPVFNLPEGYTVNSPSAQVVNNEYVGSIPAPGGVCIGALSLSGIAYRPRRLR